MKRITFILVALWLAGKLFASEASWRTSLPEAALQASNQDKLLLLDFTGSDWCGWCMKLDAEIFSTPDFLTYADRNLVLVQVDFPRRKPQSDELRDANQALKKKYSVNGFPTVLVVNPEGKVLWRQTGYVAGGPNVVIDAVNKCRKAAGLAAASEPAAPVVVAPAKPAASPLGVTIPQPVSAPQKPGDEPKLQGILYSASHSSAVLNGRTCEEGEIVHGVRVLKITRDTVTVEFKGQTNVLRMY